MIPAMSDFVSQLKAIVGNMYAANQNLARFYKECDPTNSFNPGIGKMNKLKHYLAN